MKRDKDMYETENYGRGQSFDRRAEDYEPTEAMDRNDFGFTGADNLSQFNATQPSDRRDFDPFGYNDRTQPGPNNFGYNEGNRQGSDPFGYNDRTQPGFDPLSGYPNGFSFDSDKTRPGVNPVDPLKDMWGKPQVDDYEDVTSFVPVGGVQGFMPVTGWLVSIEGPSKGRDYPIRSCINHIGRSRHMDICITGDTNISRERDCKIAYDPEENLFFFGPDEGKGIIRVNGKLIMGAVELHAYDILTIGSTKLIFVPLCGENFQWGKDECQKK